MEESTQIIPLHLKNWKNDEVVWNPDKKYDEDNAEILYGFIGEDGVEIPFAAKNEILMFTGMPKSRKTLLIQCMLMSKYTNDRNITMGFVTKGNPLVYHFDTEQPKRRTEKNVHRFYEFCGISTPDPNYRVFNIKKYTYTQKLEVIGHTILELHKETGRWPDVIIVDQIADLAPARDVNNQEGSDNVLTNIIYWQELTGALMAVVLHTNRGGQNTNGKLGVLFDQKADNQVLIEINEEGVSTVIHKLARDLKIPKFTFRQDFNGRPRLLKTF